MTILYKLNMGLAFIEVIGLKLTFIKTSAGKGLTPLKPIEMTPHLKISTSKNQERKNKKGCSDSARCTPFLNSLEFTSVNLNSNSA